MSIKYKGLLLAALYVLLVALAIPLHTQKGIEWNGQFYRQGDDGVFIANKYNRFSFTKEKDKTVFDLTVNGYACRAEMTVSNEGLYQFDFSDGFSVHLSPGTDAGNCVIVNDLSKTPLTFSPYIIEKSPFFDGETGKKQLGEWIIYETESGQHIYGWENWYDGAFPAYPPTFITLSDGAVIDRAAQYNSSVLYVNDQNEILTNQELLYTFPCDYPEERIHRQSHCHLLINTAVHERVASRGHIAPFLLSFLYFLGMAQFLWPQQLAFFGSRWQYRYEPELSDAGLAMTKFSAVFIMIISTFPLFLPLFL